MGVCHRWYFYLVVFDFARPAFRIIGMIVTSMSMMAHKVSFTGSNLLPLGSFYGPISTCVELNGFNPSSQSLSSWMGPSEGGHLSSFGFSAAQRGGPVPFLINMGLTVRPNSLGTSWYTIEGVWNRKIYKDQLVLTCEVPASEMSGHITSKYFGACFLMRCWAKRVRICLVYRAPSKFQISPRCLVVLRWRPPAYFCFTFLADNLKALAVSLYVTWSLDNRTTP